MKFFMPILLCISLSTALWAQGEEPDPFCYEARDIACDERCDTTTFTTGGNVTRVTFECWTACNNGVDPQHCRVTGSLRPTSQTTPIAICDNAGGADCFDEGMPCDQQILALQANTQYTLTVCLQSCFGTDCCGNCRASARVYEDGAECPAP